LKIGFYGRLADSIGREAELQVPEGGCTVAQLRRLLAEQHPHAAAELSRPAVRASVGDFIVGEEHVVRPGEQVEFFPPLSGG